MKRIFFLISACQLQATTIFLPFPKQLTTKIISFMLLKLTDIFVSCLPSLLFWCFCILFHCGLVGRVSTFPFRQTGVIPFLLRSMLQSSTAELIVARGCYRGWQSHDYRGMREMMVKVKCKLTGIETAGYSYDRCVFLCGRF